MPSFLTDSVHIGVCAHTRMHIHARVNACAHAAILAILLFHYKRHPTLSVFAFILHRLKVQMKLYNNILKRSTSEGYLHLPLVTFSKQQITLQGNIKITHELDVPVRHNRDG